MGEITKIFIANRGEIAVRIIKTAREMGIQTVCTFTSDDVGSLHVSLADIAVPLGNLPLSKTFLSAKKMVQLALTYHCDAIHPGYGFLSEDPEFGELCEANNIIFIGPSPEIIKLMGNKIEARKLATSYRIPVIRGLAGRANDLKKEAGHMQFPLLVKAVSGGGGKAMHIVESKEDLESSLEKAEREALNYFGEGTLFIEQYIKKARHIEIQLLGDQHGNLVHLFERECSIQRRHQKLIEEAPANSISKPLKKQLYNSALKIGEAINYNNVGTVEFLVDENENFYFIEMNTRIQVEHGVTELITGIDIVKEQIQISSGLPLSLNQNEVRLNGHAIEARIYAEDPFTNFTPTSGIIKMVYFPEHENVRVDTHLTKGIQLSQNYDPTLGKVIAFGKERNSAVEKLVQSLNESILFGCKNNASFLKNILSSEDFRKNKVSTTYVEDNQKYLLEKISEFRKKYINEIIISYFIYNFFRLKQNPVNIWEQVGYLNNEIKTDIHLENNTCQVSFKLQQNILEVSINNNPHVISQWKTNSHGVSFQFKNQSYQSVVYRDEDRTWTQLNGYPYEVRSQKYLSEARIKKERIKDNIRLNEIIFSPLFGKVLKVNKRVGDKVKQGETVIIIESMKMENNIVCPAKSIIKDIMVREGDSVKENEVMMKLDFVL